MRVKRFSYERPRFSEEMTMRSSSVRHWLVGAAMASQSSLAAILRSPIQVQPTLAAGLLATKRFGRSQPPTLVQPSPLWDWRDSFTSANQTYDFSATGQFNTWCVDIYHWLIGGTRDVQRWYRK